MKKIIVLGVTWAYISFVVGCGTTSTPDSEQVKHSKPANQANNLVGLNLTQGQAIEEGETLTRRYFEYWTINNDDQSFKQWLTDVFGDYTEADYHGMKTESHLGKYKDISIQFSNESVKAVDDTHVEFTATLNIAAHRKSDDSTYAEVDKFIWDIVKLQNGEYKLLPYGELLIIN